VMVNWLPPQQVTLTIQTSISKSDERRGTMQGGDARDLELAQVRSRPTRGVYARAIRITCCCLLSARV
jgi:hypothetical protein